MAILVCQAGRYTLAHPRLPLQYDFCTQGTDVRVVHTFMHGRNDYVFPIEEARQLWLRLRKRGYERF